MIRTYKFYLSKHIMLHQHVMNFFNRIEFETGDFDEAFWGDDFLDIVNRHPTILKRRGIGIYNQLRVLLQPYRSQICNIIRESNNIENICLGNFNPPKVNSTATGIWSDLRDFFISLYTQVLDGDGFRDKYNTTLREHFDDFGDLNESITKCPFCGIGELKKKENETRDQYDHFLPKSIYPFSSVNFDNLVPSCMECNSFNVKGETDTIDVSTGRLFFPYLNEHSKIIINICITKDALSLEDIIWDFTFSNSLRQNDEITSWRTIYKIDSRYQGFVQPRIEKWFRSYWNTVHGEKYQIIPLSYRDKIYFATLENDEELEIEFLRRPALIGLLRDSPMATASLEAKMYS